MSGNASMISSDAPLTLSPSKGERSVAGPRRAGNEGSMATVTVEATRWLCEHVNIAPPDSGGIPVTVPEGESVRGMLCRLAADRGGFWETFLDAQAQEVGGHVLVILNGRLVNPADRGESLLRDGDQVLLLPMIEGG